MLHREWYTARNAGTCIVPIKAAPDLSLLDKPRWLTTRHIYDLAESLERRAGAERARTFALYGAPGFGKTTLAQAICRDERVTDAFEHGILWVTLGARPRIRDKLATLFRELTGGPASFRDEEEGQLELAARLNTRRCLIVVDDVFQYEHLRPFLNTGPRSVRLITSRQSSFGAQLNATAVALDRMAPDDAVAMLTSGMPPTGMSRASLLSLAEQQLGAWPLLLGLFTGHVRDAVKRGQAAADAVADLIAELKARGPTALDWMTDDDRTRAVAVTLDFSLRRLSPQERARCLELSIFPEDVAIPVAVIGDLWHTPEAQARATLRAIADLGLVRPDLARRSIGVHDKIREYLRLRLEGPEAAVHARLVDAWAGTRLPPHQYGWQWQAYHLANANRHDDLRRLLTDPEWLKHKLERTSLAALIDDFDSLPERDPVRLVQSALLMDAQTVFLDPSRLPTQLLGRLRRGLSPEIDRLVVGIPAATTGPWLRPLQPALPPPGGALSRVMRGYAAGHDGTVRSIAMDPAGRWAITAGNSTQDQAVIIWNLRLGNHRKLPGQATAGGYTPLAIASDGTRALIASGAVVRLIDTARGDVMAVTPAADASVGAVALSRDGFIAVYGTDDGVLRTWAMADAVPQRLVRLSGPIAAIALDADGRLAAAAAGDEVTLWNLHERRAVDAIIGAGFAPTEFARCFTLTDRGDIFWAGPAPAEGYEEGWTRATLKQWRAGQRTIRMLQRPDVSAFFAVSADGRRAIVMHVEEGAERLALCELGESPRIAPLPRRGRHVSTAVIGADGRWAVSADSEHDLFVWNLDRAVEPLVQPVVPPWQAFRFVGFSASAPVAVFVGPGVVVLVDPDTGEVSTVEALPEIPRDEVDAAATATGQPATRARLGKRVKKGGANDYPVDDFGLSRGHTARVFERRRSPDGRWELTVSHDGSARVWDLTKDWGVASYVSEIALSRGAWASDRRTMGIVDADGHTHLLRLEGV